MTHKEITIRNLIEIGAIIKIEDGNHGEIHPKTNDYTPDGIPFIMASDIKDGHIDLINANKLPEKITSRLRKGFSTVGDVLLTHKGTLGRAAVVKSADPYLMLTPQVTLYRVNEKLLINYFLFYCFLEPVFQKRMCAIAGNGTRPYIGITAQQDLTIRYCEPAIQRSIINILRVYDDLIENNRRRIALLEQSARLLYQEWFVRFRFPGHEKVKIVDGVPEGWEKKTIKDISCYINRGITPSYADDGNSIVINQKCIRSNMLNLEPSRRQTKPFKEDKQIRFGDVLINSTGTGTLGRIAQCWIDIDKCTIDSHVTISRPKQDIQKLWYGFSIIPLQEYFEAKGEGSTNQKELNRKTIEDTKILFPSHASRELFENYVTPAVQQISILHMQNQKLAAARDLLLPRLMSGEIAV